MDLEEQGNFVWQDDSPPVFTNWAEQIKYPEENCVCTKKTDNEYGKPGEWLKVKCKSLRPFVCSMPALPKKPFKRSARKVPVENLCISEKASYIPASAP